MSKHTPGPWIAEENSKGLCGSVIAKIGYDDVQIASVTAWKHKPSFGKPSDMPSLAEGHANQRLIAAAPEMLEALEYLKNNAFAGQSHYADWESIISPVIAKARGKL